MDFQQLRYFVATAECLNLSRAAVRCQVAQPSLSQQIKRLETYLGVQLFDRLPRGMALTDAGRALLPRAQRILAEVQLTESNLRRNAEDLDGSLSIGAIPSMAPYLLPPALRQLRQERPECEFQIREDLTESLIEALADNLIDCALLSTPIRHPLLQIEVLAEEQLVVALPGDSVKGVAGTISVVDLRASPIISLHEMHCVGRQIEGFCSAARIAPQVVCRTTQLSTVFELVALGVGVSIIPEMAAATDRSQRCRYARITRETPTREIAVAWRADRSRPSAAVRMVDIVKSQLSAKLHSLPVEKVSQTATARPAKV